MKLLTLLPLLLAAGPGLAAEATPDTVHIAPTVVTAGRMPAAPQAVPAQTTVIEAPALRRSAAQTTDDLLRQVPGFGLFRRSSSAVAHPTTQGVSLRGIGASGASRTLVLLDGMPLNDPFGGWVQWSKVRPAALHRAEILRGGAHLWGNYGLSGVVHLSSRPPGGDGLRLESRGGNHGTTAVDIALDRGSAPDGLALEAGLYDTDGFPVVRRSQRGAIDGRAASRHSTLRLRGRRAMGPTAALSFQTGLFREERDNGTPLTQNGTDAGYAAFSLGWGRLTGNRWRAAAFGQVQRFDSSFSAQAADRSSERPALDQFEVPASAIGLSLEWQRTAAAHRLAAGADLRRLEGETRERFFFSEGDFLRQRRAGGDQVLWGGFVHDTYTPSPRWQLSAGLRLDAWRDAGGFRREIDRQSGEVLLDERFTERTRWVLSPHAGVRYAVAPGWSLRAAAYRSFRAPTLNELYRPFRVGNDITAANATLDAETLAGFEAGLDYARGPARWQATAFWNEVENAVANLTLGFGPGQVPPCGFVPNGGSCRQRQGLDQTRSRGLESSLAVQTAAPWSASIAYLWVDSRIRRAPTQPALEDRRLPQIPRHQWTARLGYDDPTLLTADLQARYTGVQFEDASNALPLDAFVVLDLSAARILTPGLTLFGAVENLLDTTYEVGIAASGLVTTGAPRRLSLGLRWGLSP